MEFPPRHEEIVSEGYTLYCIYFTKPYELETALSFMKLQGLSRANLVTTEFCYIFYGDRLNIPADTGDIKYNGCICNDIVYDEMKKFHSVFPLKFKKYYGGKIIYVLYNM